MATDAYQGFKEGVPLAGALRVFLAAVASFFLWCILSSPKQIAEASTRQSGVNMAASKKAFWLSLNSKELWADQPKQVISVSQSDWWDQISKKMQPGPEDLSALLCHLEVPKVVWTDKTLDLNQTIIAKIFAINLVFEFDTSTNNESLLALPLKSFRIGRLPLGAEIGKLVLQALLPSYEGISQSLGLAGAVTWGGKEAGKVLIMIPEVRRKRPPAKSSVSAKELAEIFNEGMGDIYKDKYISVEGDLEEVQSSKDISRETLKRADPLDEFYLGGLPAGGLRKTPLQVRCQIKCSGIYFLDGKGDLYQQNPEKADPASSFPVLRKGTKIRFSGGRVESDGSESRLINIYDCRSMEGFIDGNWQKIWSGG